MQEYFGSSTPNKRQMRFSSAMGFASSNSMLMGKAFVAIP